MPPIPPYPTLAPGDFEKLRALDTCTVSNAIEQFNVRLRNEGFIHSAVECRFPNLPVMLGYAATARARSSSTPVKGREYYQRVEWWEYVVSIPPPRILVLKDVDHQPGVGALCGEIHAEIGRALGCTGCVTNGAVRDLPQVEKLGFQMFSGTLAVSHAYAHIVDFGEPVEIGGLKIGSGDLLHGDRHGVHSIPQDIAHQIPAVAERILAEEHALIELCRSPDFSLERLAACLRKTNPPMNMTGSHL
jgi:4-hydroxy-4-methyl-2-oxoglutarate aldolase